MVVLVAGANGQLGQAIQFIAGNYPNIHFVFCSSSELDITNKENCYSAFNKEKPDFCINAAAYTAVDKAETEPEKAKLINVFGAKNLAEACKENNAILLHISTDFVFDGTKKEPYNEFDLPNPTGIYGNVINSKYFFGKIIPRTLSFITIIEYSKIIFQRVLVG